ncbi:Structural maintenance of chromosomes protein 5 [Vermiconidia calcicola]|uniref:Structural maintenance of chromosomes protein 5 n=1 Tax=Vermiconidia calcicola TaxID=1690605 RepID=A0ACC3MNP5_9PEZI|nr:Structural maintenance of chromosomes protein 5 [Vermiconidia calcicola]
MAYALRDISSAQFEALKGSPLSAWVTPQQSYTITRRREYGPQATSTRAQDLKEARMFTDVPVDHQGERDIDRRVAETQSEIDELKESHRVKKLEHQALEDGVKRLQQEKKILETEDEGICSVYSFVPPPPPARSRGVLQATHHGHISRALPTTHCRIPIPGSATARRHSSRDLPLPESGFQIHDNTFSCVDPSTTHPSIALWYAALQELGNATAVKWSPPARPSARRLDVEHTGKHLYLGCCA